MLVGDFDPRRIRGYIQHAVEVTQGCVMEMILKDTHTCEHHPERFTIWTDIAQEVAAQAGASLCSGQRSISPQGMNWARRETRSPPRRVRRIQSLL